MRQKSGRTLFTKIDKEYYVQIGGSKSVTFALATYVYKQKIYAGHWYSFLNNRYFISYNHILSFSQLSSWLKSPSRFQVGFS